jgi:hypothetical protein
LCGPPAPPVLFATLGAFEIKRHHAFGSALAREAPTKIVE